MRDRVGGDEVLLKFGLDCSFNLLDTVDFGFDPGARGNITKRDACPSSGSVSGG